ncbi:MAG: acyl-CoA dehydrogenase family protein [Pseudomonadales bacterium]
MEFGLSEEQIMLQESVDRFLQDTSPLDRVRELAEDGAAHDDTIWQGMAELGVTGLLVPEHYGGLGMSLLDAMLVQEMLGRYVSPVAFTATSVLAAIALTRSENESLKQQYLPAIADGSLQAAVALSEQTGVRSGAGLSISNGKLSGNVLFALGAPNATALLIGGPDNLLYLIESSANGIERQSLRSIDDTQVMAEYRFSDTPAQLVSSDTELVGKLVDAGRVMLAADTLGAAQHMLEKAVEYAKERKQFNRVIGSFQAVKHMCAEMAAGLEPCRSLVWYAAHAFDAIPEESRLTACHAKAHLSEVGRFVARTSTEVHGGMGFTDLMGLHYWFKRIGFNRQLLGSPERAREDAAKAQGWI